MLLPIEWLPDAQPAPQLLILLHGRCGGGLAMLPLARALREAFAQAAILAPDAPGRGPDGCRWFEACDAAGAVQPEAVEAALPAFAAWVRATQRRLHVGPAATALAGFCDGAALALACADRHDGLAGRVLSFGGCFARLPSAAPEATTLHLLHGAVDTVVGVERAREALQHLAALQGDATLDVAQGVGHALHPALIDSALFRLRNHIPHRTWRAALGHATHSTS